MVMAAAAMMMVVMVACVSPRGSDFLVVVVRGLGLGLTAETHVGGCMRVCYVWNILVAIRYE
jgi:hypothetical protein